MNDDRPVEDETVDEAEDEDEVQFWPEGRPDRRASWAADLSARHYADRQEDEPSGTIPIIAELAHPLATLLPQP
jgi:hypothetical protein